MNHTCFERKLTIFKGTTENRLIKSERLERLSCRGMQVIQIRRNKVGQITILRMIPALLDWIEFGRVSWQLFELKPFRMVLLEVSGDRTMHIPSVPNKNCLPTDVPVHFGEKPGQVLRLGIVRKELEIERQSAEGWGESDCPDRRDPIMPVPGLLNRRVAGQGPGATPDRLEHETRFIEKYKC
jgi:hypothetical protein